MNEDDTTDGLDPFVEQHLPSEPPEGRTDVGMFYLRYMLEYMGEFTNTVLKLSHAGSVPVDDAGGMVDESEATRMVELTPPMVHAGVPLLNVTQVYDGLEDLPDDLNYGDIVMLRTDGEVKPAVEGITHITRTETP